MKTAIVIPARFNSTRFPGKPLALISGKSLLHRTWSIAKAIQHVDAVYIATDDARIQAHAAAFGADVIMTPSDCENGSVRAFAAIKQCADQPEIILNLQGDAVLTPPWVIQPLLDAMLAEPSLEIATPATRVTPQHYAALQASKAGGAVGGTTVVFDHQHFALYFSKRLIPFIRTPDSAQVPVYRHIGLYAYRFDALARYLQLPPSALEQAEGLEQLRALENGMKIKIVPVDYRGRTHWAVDSPDDVTVVEKIIATEGELLS